MSQETKLFTWRQLKNSELVDKRLVHQIWLSSAVLLWEEFLSAAWPIGFLVGLFITVSLFGFWVWAPGWPHSIILLLFIFGFCWGLAHLVRSIEIPTLFDSIRRLERTGGESNRPVTSLMDLPAVPLIGSTPRQIWSLHIKRVLSSIRRLRVAWPTSVLGRRDRFGIRPALLLFIAIGLFVSGKEAPGRLLASMDLNLTLFHPADPGILAAWITPPGYTGLAPIFLTEMSNAGDLVLGMRPSMIAEGSKFVARVHGGKNVPTIKMSVSGVTSEVSFDTDILFGSDEEKNFNYDEELFQTARLQVGQDNSILAEWNFEVIEDEPPLAIFVGVPQETHKQILRLAYQATDDYGVKKIMAHIQRSDDHERTFSVDLRVPGGSPKSIEDASYQDLTPHPWAGMPVTIRLVVEDVAGKTGESSSINFILPARVFNHPIAKEIVEQRRFLASDWTQSEAVASALEDILSRPEDYGDDVVAYMSLRTAVQRLSEVDDVEIRSEILDLLWEVALRIEDGALSIAERDLRASEKALRDALDRNASNDEILELTRDLQENLDQFLELMERQAIQDEQGPFGDSEQAAFDPDSDLPRQVDHGGNRRSTKSDRRRDQEERNRQDLQEMLDKARELALTGSREAAQTMLQELQETLENLRQGQDEQSSGGENGTEQDIDALEELTAKQDDLLNETFEQLRGDRGDTSDRVQQGDSSQQVREAASVQEGGDNREPPELRDDQIERMDDLSAGDPSPAAARQNNSVQQTQDPEADREDPSNETGMQSETARGDQPETTAPSTREGQQQGQSETVPPAVNRQSVSPSQATRGGEGAEGNTQQRQAPGRNAGQQNNPSPQTSSQRQEQLRDELRDVMRDMKAAGEAVPAELDGAAQSMRDASEALSRERPDRAVRSQTQALNQLRQGVATLRGQRANNISDNEDTDGRASQRRQNRRDPFGRRPPGRDGDPTGYVEIPKEFDIQRSKKILDELYRRAGDSNRAESERSYIERLLRWY